MYYLLQTKR